MSSNNPGAGGVAQLSQQRSNTELSTQLSAVYEYM